MKASLQLKMNQQLAMTPQLQQAIRLLQLSTLDLQQEIQQALDSNPLLELEEELDPNEIGTAEKDNSDAQLDDLARSSSWASLLSFSAVPISFGSSSSSSSSRGLESKACCISC